MAVTAYAYAAGEEAIQEGAVDLDTTTLKVMLLTGYTYANTHATMAAVKAAGTESSGTGYTAGGQTLTSVTVTRSGDTITLDCADPAWSSSSVSATDAVFYAELGTDSQDIPLVHWDFGETKTSEAGTFTLNINASGLRVTTTNPA